MYSSFHTSHYNQNEHSDSSLDPLDPELHADCFEEQRGGVSSSYSSSATSSSSSSSLSKKRKKYGHALTDPSSDSSSSSVPQVRDRRASTELIERYAYATSSNRGQSSMSSSSSSLSARNGKSSHTSNRQLLTITPTFKRSLALVFGNVCLLFAISSISVVSPNGIINAIGTFISTVQRTSLYHTHRALCSTDEMALVSSSFRRALITVTGIFIGYTKAGQDDPDIAMLLNCDSFWLPYIPVPDHLQVVCPERQDSPCPKGSFVKNDCACTTPDEDPCVACPDGTRCQKEMMNLPLMCIDCTCSFCNVDQESCCSFDGETNTCTTSSRSDGVRDECTLESGYFAPFHGIGSTCESIEITYMNPPSGCSCIPSATESCVYNPNDRSIDDQCSVCDARDLSRAVAGGPNKCDDCRDCLEQCHPCVGGSSTFGEMYACLSSKEINSETECRESCASSCMRNQRTAM